MGGLVDMLALRVALTKLALVEDSGAHTRIFEYPWPGFNFVEVAACWLFVNEVQLVGKLFESDLSGELCQGTVDGGQVAFIGLRIEIPIHSRSATE